MSETYDSLAYYRIKQLEEELQNLREKNKQLNNDNTALQHTVDDFVVKCKDLQQQLDAECKKKQDLQQQVDMVGKNYCEAAKRVGELVREKGDLQRQLDSLKTAMGRLRERYEEEVVCRRKWAKLAGYRDKRIEALQLQIDVLKQRDMVFVDLDSVKLVGMEELWAMLGKMFSADPCEVGNIFGWCSINNIAHYTPDVREFLKKYKTWNGCAEETDKYIQKFHDEYEAWKKDTEQKRLDYMRDYLHRFCQGHICLGCPLEAEEFKCGHIDFFKELIPDEDVKRYYEKAWNSFKEEKPSDEEVPCSFGWKLDGTEFSIETSIPRKDYDNIVKIISGKE